MGGGGQQSSAQQGLEQARAGCTCAGLAKAGCLPQAGRAPLPSGINTAVCCPAPTAACRAAPELLWGERCTEKADIYSYGRWGGAGWVARGEAARRQVHVQVPHVPRTSWNRSDGVHALHKDRPLPVWSLPSAPRLAGDIPPRTAT